ncbi:MAG TPA: hypothetical protein VN239_00455 [Nitrososphaera sp.]|nr:hypothetical protein [Nitrososphaera sp.]
MKATAGTLHLSLLKIYPLPTINDIHIASKKKKKMKMIMMMFAEDKRDSRQCLTTRV